MKWYEWIVLFLCFWLLISPWVLNFESINLLVYNNVILAILIALFTLWHLPEYHKDKINEVDFEEKEENNKKDEN